ncbi:MAG: hypothetical protein GY730_09410 [bacterium]|nr:hypothetical protein [bacterium]
MLITNFKIISMKYEKQSKKIESYMDKTNEINFQKISMKYEKQSKKIESYMDKTNKYMRVLKNSLKSKFYAIEAFIARESFNEDFNPLFPDTNPFLPENCESKFIRKHHIKIYTQVQVFFNVYGSLFCEGNEDLKVLRTALFFMYLDNKTSEIVKSILNPSCKKYDFYFDSNQMKIFKQGNRDNPVLWTAHSEKEFGFYIKNSKDKDRTMLIAGEKKDQRFDNNNPAFSYTIGLYDNYSNVDKEINNGNKICFDDLKFGLWEQAGVIEYGFFEWRDKKEAFTQILYTCQQKINDNKFIMRSVGSVPVTMIENDEKKEGYTICCRDKVEITFSGVNKFKSLPDADIINTYSYSKRHVDSIICEVKKSKKTIYTEVKKGVAYSKGGFGFYYRTPKSVKIEDKACDLSSVVKKDE